MTRCADCGKDLSFTTLRQGWVYVRGQMKVVCRDCFLIAVQKEKPMDPVELPFIFQTSGQAGIPKGCPIWSPTGRRKTGSEAGRQRFNNMKCHLCRWRGNWKTADGVERSGSFLPPPTVVAVMCAHPDAAAEEPPEENVVHSEWADTPLGKHTRFKVKIVARDNEITVRIRHVDTGGVLQIPVSSVSPAVELKEILSTAIGRLSNT